MDIKYARVKSVKADMAKNEIQISFSIGLNDEDLQACRKLANLVGTDTPLVDLSIKLPQIDLFNVEVKTFR